MTPQSSILLLVMLIELILLAKLITAIDRPMPECPETCGDLKIPFPFGTKPDCYLDGTFLITCNNSESFLRKSKSIRVRNISLVDGQMTVLSSVARGCYNASGALTGKPNSPRFTLTTFSVSSTGNRFTVIGCNTAAMVAGLAEGSKEDDYRVGCISLCNSLESIENGTCSGIGCCQASIPDGVRNYRINIGSISNSTIVHDFNPCSYAFVAEKDYFNFSTAKLKDWGNTTQKVPMVLDFAVGNITCEEAKKIESSYACRSVNSNCTDSPSRRGYFCTCSKGYEGNPYLKDGCKDIKECEDPNRCKGKCKELEGSYRCYCPKGFDGDGESEVCRRSNTFLYAALGALSILLLLLMGSSWIYHVVRQRKLSKIRENFFRKNGGLLLEEKISKQTGCTNRALIFTEEDLKKATDNFSETTVIGKGGFGTVHKGVIPDDRVVAIKKSRVTNQSQNEQFINEVIIVSEINHRNVVKLIGCCLETEIPLLVYEFITNGTLFSHIHDEFLSSYFTWDIRLKVAAETADALAYLHSAASVPIIHRDVKSVNILLDKNYNAKVADFGASRFIPLDKTEVTTLVQGTFGYLDPEYFHTSQLTDKSDVYSFGVVLAELLTGEEAVSFGKSEKERNLAMYFVSSINQNKLLEILDGRLGVLDKKIEQVEEVGLLAKRCLNVKAEERPTMKEVAMELQGMKAWRQHPWTENNMNPEETEYLLSTNVSSSSGIDLVGSSKGYSATGEFDSMNIEKIAHLNDGR